MPLTRPPAPPVPPTRTAPPVAPRPMAPPPQRAAAPQPASTRAVQGPAGAGVAAAPRPVGRPPGAATAPQAVMPGSATTAQLSTGPSDVAIRSAQLRFYTAGATFFETQLNAQAKDAAPVARPSVSAPSVATAQKAPTPAAPGPEQRPVGRPPGRPPASPPTQQAPAPVQAAPRAVAPSTNSGEVPSADVLAGMTRKDLVDMAKGMGLETQGVKGEDLRVMIANAGGPAPAEESESAEDVPIENSPSANEQFMEVRAQVNMGIIDANLDKYEAYLDPASTDPNALKCGGDCARCPNPGKYLHAADQIAHCYRELHTDLNLEQQYPVEAAA